MSLPLQWPYRASRDGIWLPQTSTLNWCEEDYNVTPYVAEFFNTITNLIFIYLGIMGVRDCLRYGAAKVYILTYLGYIVVGLGSMAFHATLKCGCAPPVNSGCWMHALTSISRLDAAGR